MGDLHDYQRDYAAWRTAQFPDATVVGTLRHLRGEIDELERAILHAADGPTHGIGAELADCTNMLVSLAGLLDVDLESAVAAKWAIVRERTYPTAARAPREEPLWKVLEAMNNDARGIDRESRYTGRVLPGFAEPDPLAYLDDGDHPSIPQTMTGSVTGATQSVSRT